MAKPVKCGHCGHEFKTCPAPAGRNCQRPSGHQPWSGWGRFHDERDMMAARCGAYHHDCKQPDPESCGLCYP